jgi:hypothetical protein
MQPADDIKKLIDEARITSSPGVDRRILAEALEDLEKRRAERAACPRPAVWRIVMNSKWTKFAGAAVLGIAILVALPLLRPFGSGVTFAKAIQPILNANSAILDVIIGEDKEGVPILHDMVVGSRIRRTLSNVPNNVSIIDLQTGRILNLDESKKEAAYIDLKGLPSIPNYLDHLKNILVTLQDSPQFVTEDLGTRQIDGREAVGFRSKHPKIEVVLWADARTGLPVRIESREGQLNVVCKNLQFDVPMDASLFSMEVPEGYKQQTMELDLLGSTEADFIEGLRVLAETYGDGQFPDGVGLEDFLKQAPAMREKIEKLNLSDEQGIELGAKLQKHILFLRFFQGQGKWYYRGKGVRLGEADKAIFWYRPKDSPTYRVIYGDLHVEDVAPENLPEPLNADDVAVAANVGYQQWSKPDFVGSQGDFYYVLPDGRVQVKAYLALIKGPKDTSTMPVRLPYPQAPLEAVLLGTPGQPGQDFVALPFQKIGDGTYNIDLPLDKLSAGQTTLIFQWHMALDEFGLEQGKRWVELKSLIPVTFYKLRVGVDPKSDFELTLPAKDTWAEPYTREPSDTPGIQFGRCGLPVKKRQ